MKKRSAAPFLKRFGIEMAQHDRIREATEKLHQKGIEFPPGEEEAVELVHLIRDGKLERARDRFPLGWRWSDGTVFEELLDEEQEAAKAVDDPEKELSWPPGGCVSDS